MVKNTRAYDEALKLLANTAQYGKLLEQPTADSILEHILPTFEREDFQDLQYNEEFMKVDPPESLFEIVKRIESGYTFETFPSDVLDEDITDLSDVECLEEDHEFLEQEVIFYAKAMDILAAEDPSLRNSLSAARDMGYNIEDLDSEKLASLLMSEQQCEAFSEFLSELRSYIDTQGTPQEESDLLTEEREELYSEFLEELESVLEELESVLEEEGEGDADDGTEATR